MRAVCKSTFGIGKGSNFLKGSYYNYYTSKHSETGVDIYYVIGEDGDSQPMLRRTFDENFNNLEEIRNDKIDYLLRK